MAEGGSLSSLNHGSDADFEIICTPCGEDSVREEAVMYCPQCQEYLCSTCTRHHGRLKATRTHKLLDKDEAKQRSSLVRTKCRYHPDRDIEMYCETHDMVYCVMCIATEHRSCSGINKIEDVAKSFVNQTEVQRVSDEVKRATERIKALANKQQKNITSLEEQRKDIQQQLQELEKRLIDHIKKITKDTSKALENCYLKEKGGLQYTIRKLTDTIQNLEKATEQMQSVDSMDTEQIFVQLKLGQNTLTDASKIRDDKESNQTMNIYFTENTDLVSSVTTAVALGGVLAQVKPKEYKMKSMKNISVKKANDKTICIISDVCRLPGGSFILTDQVNKKIKRLDMNYKITDHCDLDAVPTGVCFIGKNEVAVKLNNNKIQFLSVASTLSKTRCLSVDSGNYCGIASCAGKIWTSTGNDVKVYNSTGNRVKIIDKDQNGKAIIKSSTQHMAVCDNDVIVTDWSDGAVCLNKDGKVIRELRDSRLRNTCGVCVSDDGTAFLCGYYSNNIVMYSRDGKCLGELVAADAGLKNPISLCYDSNKNNLLVICDCCDTVNVVELDG